MSIFSRIFKVGQAGVNKAIDKIETPELMLDQAIRDKEKQIKEAKQAVMSCIATEKQAKALLDKDKLEQSNWEAKAEAALKANREDLAVKALARDGEHEKKALEMEPRCQEQRKKPNLNMTSVWTTKKPMPISYPGTPFMPVFLYRM